MKLIDLMSLHLKDVLERIAAKKLAPKTKGDYIKLQGLIYAAKLDYTDTDILGPAHFVKLMEAIENRGYSFRTQKNIIASFKAVFNWGGPEGMNLIIPPTYGPRFRAPSKRQIEAQQEVGPSRYLDRLLILDLLNVASPKMKVAILLGINCGFYPSDTIAIKLDHIKFSHKPPYHDFRRVKTLRQRRAVLWPETIKAIVSHHEGLFMVAPNAYVVHRDDGKPHSPNADKLAGPFRTLLRKIGRYSGSRGLGFGIGLGSLRHTYATIIDTVQDQSMIDLTMGHTNPSIQKRTYRQLNPNEITRLTVLANTVHQWLFEGDPPYVPF